MTPADFAAFVALCKERHGWGKTELARRLGCGRNMVAAWQKSAPPLYIGLACAALIYGLPAWRSLDNERPGA